MSHGKQYSTKDIIAALEKTKGAVTLAAELLGCSYKTIERRAAAVQDVQEVIDRFRERRLDIAELALDVALANGESWAVQFALKTQGKRRGYVEGIEHSTANGKPLTIRVVYDEPH